MKTLEQLEDEILKGMKILQSRESTLPVARLIVEARRDHFLTPRGEPDLQGRSYAWRTWYGDILRKAFQDEDERLKMGARVRYGIGVALREMLTPDELEASGLQKTGPKERIAKNNAERAAAYKTVTENIETHKDVLELYGLVVGVASNIQDPELLQFLFNKFDNLKQDAEYRMSLRTRLRKIDTKFRPSQSKSE